MINAAELHECLTQDPELRRASKGTAHCFVRVTVTQEARRKQRTKLPHAVSVRSLPLPIEWLHSRTQRL
ncbi:MAG: hypothetical protein DLM70_04585 [Chloroflexi bacterium]|nr:MAG: hypothetical protein DLM70_04585 [Chloroflexota bacterium]